MISCSLLVGENGSPFRLAIDFSVPVTASEIWRNPRILCLAGFGLVVDIGEGLGSIGESMVVGEFVIALLSLASSLTKVVDPFFPVESLLMDASSDDLPVSCK